MTSKVGFSSSVPANVSRYFRTKSEARAQSRAIVDLAWDEDDPFLFNASFEPSLIRHDSAYCTSSWGLADEEVLPTATYFDDLISSVLPSISTVIDIGCGQGEFVAWLRRHGWSAAGYDPVLRRASEHLHRRYWSPDEPGADLLVMRCVLPHIDRPWHFLNDVAKSNEDSVVLVEYQRLEFILEKGLWFQIAHDHVNQFQLADFAERFDLLGSGVFAAGEWEYVVFQPSSYRVPVRRACSKKEAVGSLAEKREKDIQLLQRMDSPISIWGAAGKGAIIADALVSSGVQVRSMIDADRAKEGLFMAVSGVQVRSPEHAFADLGRRETLIVANPNHLRAVQDFVARKGRADLEVATLQR